MKIDRHLAFHTRRDAWVEINLTAIEHNVFQLKQHLPDDVALMAVIKADAYGHGAPMMVPILEGADVAMLGVASVDEAIQLKETQTQLPILVLGPTPEWAMRFAAEEGFQISIFSERHLEVLEAAYAVNQKPTQVQIKVDTGMHRIGIPVSEALAFYERCVKTPYLDVQGIFSHLAAPDDAQILKIQRDNWSELLSKLPSKPKWYHLISSSSLFDDMSRDNNMARVGLALFGYGPKARALNLHPAMRLKARIVQLKTILPGEGVSYGHTFVNQTQSPLTIAALPLGYADGVPRGLSNQINMLYKDRLVPQVGTICMDQCLVNVTDVPDAQVGDVITLIGQERSQAVWLDNWAGILGSIEYEMMTNLRVRLPRTYIRAALEA